jgi:hypothetical protein
MKSPFLFLSLTLLAQLTAYNIASSSGMPNFNVARTSTVCTMLVLAGQSNKGNKYSAPDGSFTVKFPGKPSEQNQTVQTEIGPIKVLSVYCHAHRGRRTFAVSRSQSKGDPGDNVEDGIAGTINGMVKSQNATVSHEIKINYKGVPGRQLYLTTKQGKEKSRIFAVKAGNDLTIYMTTVLDTSGKVDDAEVNSFLDSLTFKSRANSKQVKSGKD